MEREFLAKENQFIANGNETLSDIAKMLKVPIQRMSSLNRKFKPKSRLKKGAHINVPEKKFKAWLLSNKLERLLDLEEGPKPCRTCQAWRQANRRLDSYLVKLTNKLLNPSSYYFLKVSKQRYYQLHNTWYNVYGDTEGGSKYSPIPETVDIFAPVYQLISFSAQKEEMWLYLNRNQKWVVGPTKAMLMRSEGGSLKSIHEAKPGQLPQDMTRWFAKFEVRGIKLTAAPATDGRMGPTVDDTDTEDFMVKDVDKEKQWFHDKILDEFLRELDEESFSKDLDVLLRELDEESYVLASTIHPTPGFPHGVWGLLKRSVRMIEDIILLYKKVILLTLGPSGNKCVLDMQNPNLGIRSGIKG